MDTNSTAFPFAQDTLTGLASSPKKLSSKYFYDDIGSKIFQEIMEMSEYYPTNAELEILQQQPADIIRQLNYKNGFNIIELGAGDGYKTKELLKYINQQNIDCTYFPVDISQKAMDLLEEDIQQTLPNLKIKPLVGDYFKVLSELQHGNKPALFLFLGGNIGNYEKSEAIDLLKMFRTAMQEGDHLLIGMDLKKNPATILQAYNDPHGITRRFNLNLLNRMNNELGANFNIEQFDFYAYYNPRNGEVRSMLVSLEKQDVYFSKLDKTIQFDKNELTWTELSKKYGLNEIKNLALSAGYEVKQNFFDTRNYFTDSLWTT